jgi:hypothetical protein
MMGRQTNGVVDDDDGAHSIDDESDPILRFTMVSNYSHTMPLRPTMQ